MLSQSRSQKQESGLRARTYCRPFKSPFWLCFELEHCPKSQPHEQNVGKITVTPPRKLLFLLFRGGVLFLFNSSRNKYADRIAQEDGMPMAENEKSETWNTGKLTPLILKNAKP